MRNYFINKLLLLYLVLFSPVVLATPDQQLTVIDVSDTVKSIVGPITNRTTENLGNNATFGVVITQQGVILIDSGGSYKGAEAIHTLIKAMTDQPVKFVINTGGQDHRWFGNSYFRKLGAKIISSKAVKLDHQKRESSQLGMLSSLIGDDAIKGTQPEVADILFDEEYTLKLGDRVLEIHHKGQAHTPGDAFVWLAKEKIMFTGDIVYLDRMLGVGAQSHSGEWIKTFEAMAKYKPEIIIPGHGKPATLKEATQFTYDYLMFLRTEVSKLLDDDKDMLAIKEIDQSKYKDLKNFEVISGRNAQKVFSEMEFE